MKVFLIWALFEENCSKLIECVFRRKGWGAMYLTYAEYIVPEAHLITFQNINSRHNKFIEIFPHLYQILLLQ